MPASTILQREASRVFEARRVISSSEAASLKGKRALTPILAGSICGGIMLLAWIIGFSVYFRKRYNRKKRNRLIAQGKAQPREKDLKMLQEKVVIPPDPAVLLGQRQPGEMVFPEREQSNTTKLPWSSSSSSAFPKSNSKIPSSPSKGVLANDANLAPTQTSPSSIMTTSGPQHAAITKEPSGDTNDETPLMTLDMKNDVQIVDEMTVPPKA
ncbi:hypothetical protein CPB83DRAFT_812532 [Crepidotus variabilis]|uniref:Uncharacterized protein n=1 Tax=Crepidotus variabilis TaxID=179855 RepID=A0A9P6JQI3_9AGAR|nr:hypothetical protein CPB83DRAFT_812532 [Crepidotus variabilis]